MTFAVTSILMLMLLLGINISGYSGMTVSEAFNDARTNHNYTISDAEFDRVSSEYINNPNYDSSIITTVMIADATRAYMADNAYDYLVSSGELMWDEINGQFDQSWMPSADARTIRVYDQEGYLLGATTIIGVVDRSYRYADRVSTRPTLINKTGYFQNGYLLFYTTSQDGGYYHTDLDYTYPSTGTVSSIGINLLSYKYWYNNTADNVSFSDVGARAFPISLVYQGVEYPTNQYFVSPITGDNSTDTETDYIGTATLQDGTEVGVNPDGSVTLPDGTVVRPDPITGLYPYPVISIDFPPDFWARVAEGVGDGAVPTAQDDAQQQAWDISGLRDLVSNIMTYISSGFWTDLKTFLTPDVEVDKTEIQRLNPQNRFMNWLDEIYWGFTGYHISGGSRSMAKSSDNQGSGVIIEEGAQK